MKEEDQAQGLMETLKIFAEAGMMAKGMRLRRPEKPRVAIQEKTQPGGIKMKESVKPLAKAVITAKEGTAQWHTEVVNAVIDNKAAPSINATSVKVEAAKLSLATPETGRNVKFLLDNGVPKSDIVAVVAADIAESSFRNDPVYLVAKEAQLVHSLRSEMVLSEQIEIAKAAKQIHERVAYLKGVNASIPSKIYDASDMLRTRMASVLEEKVMENRQKPEGKKKAKNEEDTIEDVHEDIKESLNDILIVMAGGDVGIETKIRLMNIPDDAATFLAKKVLENTPLQDALKQYAKEIGGPGRTSQQKVIQTKFVIEVSDILGDPSIKTEMMKASGFGGGGKSGAEVWDATKKSGNRDLDEYLKKVQYMMDSTPGFKGDPRRLRKVLDDLQDVHSGFTADQLNKVGNPQNVIESMADAAETESRRLQEEIYRNRPERGESIMDQYSSMFLASDVRKLTVLYPEWGFNQLYRKYNEAVGFDTRGAVPQQIQRQLQQVVEYYASSKYESDIQELMENPEWRKEIADATKTPIEVTTERFLGPDKKPLTNPDGTPVYRTDLVKMKEHPFFKDRVKRLREISRIIQAKDNIDYSYGVMKMGMDIKKTQVSVLGALGDRGIYDIKADGGFINGTANHILDDLGDIYKRNFERGHKQRIGDKEMDSMRFDLQYVLEANKKEFGEHFTNHFQNRSSIKESLDGKYDYSGLCRKIGIQNETMEFSSDVIKGVVLEAQKLNTVTLREVYTRTKALSPGASDGQNFQGPKYGGESGLSQYLQARQMYEHLIERWDLMDPASKLHMRVMAHQYAEITGVTEATKIMVDQAMQDPSYKLRIAADALDVYEMDPGKRKERIEQMLGFHFGHDLKGYPVKNPPKTIEALTRHQLEEVINFKEGMKYADLVIGGYGYEGASWVCKPKIDMYDLIYGADAWTRGIGVGDYKRILGGEFIGAESAHQREHIAHKLMHGEHGQPGVLHVQGEYLTTRSFQDLIEHNHYETIEKYKAMVNGGYFEGVFSHIKTKEAATISADRPDLAIQYMKITDRITDELLSFEKTGGGPINWHHGPTEIQDGVLTTVCKNMGVNKDKFIKLKKELSNFVTQEPQLKRLTMSDMVDTYIDVQDLESREKFLDNPLEAPGSQYSVNKKHSNADVVERVSGYIGEESGKSEKCGIARVAGDNGSAQASATMVVDLLGVRSFEPFQKALPDLKKNILFTYGGQFAARGVAVVGGSWMNITAMDRADDWLIYGSVFNQLKNSPIRRVTGNVGDHGDLATTINERHGMWEQLQKDLKEAFGTTAPGMNTYMEKEMGLIWEYVGIDGKHHHTDAPWRIYTYYLAGLAGLGISIGLGAKTAKEGYDEGGGGSKGSGGGGGGAHH